MAVPTLPAGITDKDIACAFAIVKSKPPEVSTPDYLDHIRDHIARGRRDQAASSVYRHLDRSSYWRAKAKRAENETHEARHQSLQLKLEVEALKTKLEATKTTNSARKRKKVDEDVVLVPRSPTKVKRDTFPIGRTAVVQPSCDFEQDFGFGESGKDGELLMRSLYHISRTLKTFNKTDPTALTYHLINAATALSQVISQAVTNSLGKPLKCTKDLREVLSASARSAALMIVGLSRLSRVTQTPTQSLGQVIHAFIRMFAILLETFQEAAESEANQNTTAEQASKTPSSSIKGKAKVKPPRAANVRDNALLNKISSFLTGIVDLLDPKIDIHTELFEGFIFCLFNRLGSRLHLFAFDHARNASLEEEIEEGDTFFNESGGELRLRDAENTLAQRSARLEAPYLVYMLRKTMASAPGHFGRATGKRNQQGGIGKGGKGALAAMARERVQRTLVNAIFGAEGLEEGNALLDCLTKPVAKGVVAMPRVKEENVKEWFKEEVWHLVGWGVLADEGGF